MLQERADLAILLRFVERRSDGSQQAPPSLASFSFSEDEIPDAAWRTASSTGVLAFMDYAQVQRFAGAYREQELLQQQEQQALTDILQLGSSIRQDRPPAALTSAEAKEALPYIRRALADPDGILAAGAGMVEAYQNALK